MVREIIEKKNKWGWDLSRRRVRNRMGFTSLFRGRRNKKLISIPCQHLLGWESPSTFYFSLGDSFCFLVSHSASLSPQRKTSHLKAYLYNHHKGFYVSLEKIVTCSQIICKLLQVYKTKHWTQLELMPACITQHDQFLNNRTG